MCLGIPGKIQSIYDEQGLPMGLVDYNGVRRAVCLSAVPGTKPGDYIIVHAGFAITKMDEQEALETLTLLDEISSVQ